MSIIHDMHANNALDFLVTKEDTIYQAVGRSNRTAEQKSVFRKEITMHTNGHTTVWGTHIGASCAKDAKSLYKQLKEWWQPHKAARHEAKLAALNARWDAKREAVTPCRAEAAPEMAVEHHALSIAMMLHGLSQ
jgi:hypothetical protein